MDDFPDHLTVIEDDVNAVQERIDSIFDSQQREGQLGGKKARTGTKRKLSDILRIYLDVAGHIRKKVKVKLGESMKMAKKVVVDFKSKNPSVSSIEEVVKGSTKLFDANPGKYKV